MVPQELTSAVGEVLGDPVRTSLPIDGGCINNGSIVETASGRRLFLKWNRNAPEGMFAAEIDGLEALRSTAALRVPEPMARGPVGDEPAWLLMEYIEPGSPSEAYDRSLGDGLAAMHDATADGGPGWPTDNWIGTLTQSNRSADGWGTFWRDSRLAPQLELARANGFLDEPLMDELLGVIPEALAGVEDLSLLHGDLWSGNVFPDTQGQPVLIDPAVYRGHGEVDLAMSELFSGFGAGFYEAYTERRGVGAEYDIFRRDLYQLYFLLVHVNIFGASYVGASLAAARTVVSEWR